MLPPHPLRRISSKGNRLHAESIFSSVIWGTTLYPLFSIHRAQTTLVTQVTLNSDWPSTNDRPRLMVLSLVCGGGGVRGGVQGDRGWGEGHACASATARRVSSAACDPCVSVQSTRRIRSLYAVHRIQCISHFDDIAHKQAHMQLRDVTLPICIILLN